MHGRGRVRAHVESRNYLILGVSGYETWGCGVKDMRSYTDVAIRESLRAAMLNSTGLAIFGWPDRQAVCLGTAGLVEDSSHWYSRTWRMPASVGTISQPLKVALSWGCNAKNAANLLVPPLFSIGRNAARSFRRHPTRLLGRAARVWAHCSSSQRFGKFNRARAMR